MSTDKHIMLALGGTRSGKSDFAEDAALSLAKEQDKRAVYVATGQAFDDEMKARIKRHLDRRDPYFETVEEPLDLVRVLSDHHENDVLLIDSLGVWITNLMINDVNISQALEQTLDALDQTNASVFMVSDEIGMGIVPDNAMSRQFRDHIGLMNQNVASRANKVVFMVAGLPMIMKST